VTTDSLNTYLYDAEGRLCAVVNSNNSYWQYVYDAEGNRVARGALAASISSCSGTPTYSKFQSGSLYLELVTGGNQVTELQYFTTTGAQWTHTNAFAGGLLATYASSASGYPFAFHMKDPLGTRRVLTDAVGKVLQSCQSLPYGNGESCTPTPTEQLFTGKERDTESGNDYFGARYYASTMGRMLSPDPYAGSMNPAYPQSFNRYVYAANNPLRFTDPTGLDCVYMNDSGTGVDKDANGNVTGIDHNSNSGECGKNGGDWVDGHTEASWVGYDSTNDEFHIGSISNGNVLETQATAPHGSGFWANVFGCTGNCTTGQSSIGLGELQSQLQPTGASVTDLLGWLARQTSIPSPGSMGNMPVQFQLVSSFCGPGGYGVPNGSSDWGCVAHDFQYAITGNTYPNPTDPNYKGGPQLKNINQTLCDHTGGAIHLAAEFTFNGIWGCN
jgi:RHS repeat-associated protein